LFETTIHRLRVFQSVVESGSIGLAASKLRVTQPSISAHIHALEQELGKMIFTRNPGKKLTLTEAGQILYAFASEVTSKTNQVEQSLKNLQIAQRNISVAAQRNISNNLLPSYLSLFTKTFPDFDILLYSQTQEIVIEQVLEGKADLGLVMTLEPVDGLISEVLTFEKLELFVGPTHELAHKTSINPAELENHSFVGGVKTSRHAKMIDLVLKKLGIRNYNVVLQLEDNKTMIEVIKRGMGIAVIPTFSVKDELKDGKLVRLPIQSEPVMLEIRLVYKSDSKMSDEARLFTVFLRREMGTPKLQ
jgi:DNA-binding transcriptional LysR family regulator